MICIRILTVVEVQPGEVVLAVVARSVHELPDAAGHSLHHSHGVEEHLSVLVREGADLPPHVLGVDRELVGPCHPGGLLGARVGTPQGGVSSRFGRVERDDGALFFFIVLSFCSMSFVVVRVA